MGHRLRFVSAAVLAAVLVGLFGFAPGRPAYADEAAAAYTVTVRVAYLRDGPATSAAITYAAYRGKPILPGPQRRIRPGSGWGWPAPAAAPGYWPPSAPSRGRSTRCRSRPRPCRPPMPAPPDGAQSLTLTTGTYARAGASWSAGRMAVVDGARSSPLPAATPPRAGSRCCCRPRSAAGGRRQAQRPGLGPAHHRRRAPHPHTHPTGAPAPTEVAGQRPARPPAGLDPGADAPHAPGLRRRPPPRAQPGQFFGGRRLQFRRQYLHPAHRLRPDRPDQHALPARHGALLQAQHLPQEHGRGRRLQRRHHHGPDLVLPGVLPSRPRARSPASCAPPSPASSSSGWAPATTSSGRISRPITAPPSSTP